MKTQKGGMTSGGRATARNASLTLDGEQTLRLVFVDVVDNVEVFDAKANKGVTATGVHLGTRHGQNLEKDGGEGLGRVQSKPLCHGPRSTQAACGAPRI